MIFIPIFKQDKCIYIYSNGQIREPLYDNLSYTWNYFNELEDHNHVDIVQLYCQGDGISDCCPEELQEKWSSINLKLKQYFKHNSKLKLVEAEGYFTQQVVLQELKASSLKPDGNRVMCVYVNDDNKENN